MADCTKCASSTSCERVWKNMPNAMCVGFSQVKTNADKIRKQNDEELAQTLSLVAKGGVVGQRRVEDWLGWPKQEAKE